LKFLLFKISYIRIRHDTYRSRPAPREREIPSEKRTERHEDKEEESKMEVEAEIPKSNEDFRNLIFKKKK
jgi:hypothetical protein